MSDRTAPIPTGSARTPRRRRRVLVALIVALVLVVLLIVAYFVADTALRSYAEDRIEGEIRDRLPSEVTGNVNVRLGGASFVVQYLAGSFDRVDIDGQDISINGLPVDVGVVATGVPVDRSTPIDSAVGTLTLGEDAVNTLLADVADVPADIRLEDGAIGYASSFRILGFDLTYDVTAEPQIEGDTVVLTPTGATLTSAPGGLDLGDVLGDDLSSLAVPVCVAQYLPEDVSLRGLDVATGELTGTFMAKGLLLSEETLTTLGSCTRGG